MTAKIQTEANINKVQISQSRMVLFIQLMPHLRRIRDRRTQFDLADKLYRRIPENIKGLLKLNKRLTITRPDYKPLSGPELLHLAGASLMKEQQM